MVAGSREVREESIRDGLSFASARHGARPLPEERMSIRTEYTRFAAKLARKVHADSALGGAPAPDGEFYKQLAKALDEIAEALESLKVKE